MLGSGLVRWTFAAVTHQVMANGVGIPVIFPTNAWVMEAGFGQVEAILQHPGTKTLYKLL